MVRLCHHHRTTPDEVRTWPLPVYLALVDALDAEQKAAEKAARG